MTNPVLKYLGNNHFLTTLIVLAVLWLAVELKELLIIIFISYIIMAALFPFSDFLTRKHIPKVLSVLILYLIIITVLVLLIFPLVPFTISQIQLLFNSFPKYIDQVAKIPNLRIDQSSVNNFFKTDINLIGTNALNITGSIFSGIFSVFTVLIISFYLMLEKETLTKQLITLFPKKYQENALTTITQIDSKIGLWLRAQLVFSFAIGVITWGGLAILGLPFALPLGLITGLMEIIPIIGVIISAALAVIVALTISPGLAVSVIVFYLLLQVIKNNIAFPRIMQKAVGLNPIVIILGILIATKFLGIIGALIAIPLITVILIIIKSLKPSY